MLLRTEGASKRRDEKKEQKSAEESPRASQSNIPKKKGTLNKKYIL